MNKKAFVLMETIVVIVIISVALLTIFASYNKILSKVKTENKYDTSEYIYMTNYVKQKLSECKSSISVDDIGTSTDFSDHYSINTCSIKNENKFNIKKIYILTNLNTTSDENLKKFDAYMIDYIKKLDVGDSDNILIVEYRRPALDINGEPIYDTRGIPNGYLYETYIASLEWDNE